MPVTPPVDTTTPSVVPPVVPAPDLTLPSEPQPEKLFAGKYKTVEELEKGYTEIQKLMSGKKKDDPDPPPPPKKDGEPDPAADAVAAAGLDMANLNKEFAETGTLSEASFKALEGKGITKDMVDAYIAGQEALTTLAVAEVHTLAGGKDAYESMLEWAKVNVIEADKEKFNASMLGDTATKKAAIAALKTQYVKAVGSSPTLIVGEGAPPVAQGYESRAQMVADMSDPRYQKDPAYRNKVAAKLMKTTAF